MVLNKSLLLGLLLGLVIPFVGYAVILMITEQLEEVFQSSSLNFVFRSRTIAVLAIAINLIPFQIYRNRKEDSGMRGILLVTFIYVFAWIFIFGKEMF